MKPVKLGVRKNGSLRLWIEGARLFKAGFNSGDKFAMEFVKMDEFDHGTTIITKDVGGSRTVSGKPRKNGKPRPIIDVHNGAFATLFPSGLVNIEFGPHQLIVRDSSDTSTLYNVA
tara:strand:+ start:106 stop:453 length:348 start_codon:yes stop_codon:yes gene_type:complete